MNERMRKQMQKFPIGVRVNIYGRPVEGEVSYVFARAAGKVIAHREDDGHLVVAIEGMWVDGLRVSVYPQQCRKLKTKGANHGV